MNRFFTLIPITLVAALLSPTWADAADAIEDESLGLSKESVFAVPAPDDFTYSDKFPGSAGVAPRSYPGAPPQIPHDIESFLPVSKTSNMCLGCHDRQGQKKQAGQPTPVPASHYTVRRGDGAGAGKLQKKLSGAQYVCTQCHVPQARVKELTGNSFRQ